MAGAFVDDCKLVVQFGTMAAAFHKASEKRYRDPPDVDATARDFPRPKYVRAREGKIEAVTTGCTKALVDLEGKLENLMPRGGQGAHCTAPPPLAALRQLEYGPRPDNALMPESILRRARKILGLGGWIVCHARHNAMLGFVAISRCLSPGRLAKCAWGKLIQRERCLVNTKDTQLKMRQCPPRAGAAFFSDFYTLNDPVPGEEAMARRACSLPRATRRWQRPP